MSKSAIRSRCAAVVAPLLLVGCAPTLGPGAALSGHPDWKGTTTCGVTAGRTEPLIVEWPSVDRARLEALFKQGIVAVSYTGCTMEVLADCSAESSYRYVATLPKHDVVRIRTADELYASLPFGAAQLEGKLQGKSELEVSMSIVGRYQSELRGVRSSQLKGSCAKATHVISGLTVGAFEFAALTQSSGGARVSVFGSGAAGESARSREDLGRDGKTESCKGAQGTDKEPPAECRALLRIEVTPLPEAEERLAQAEAKTREAEQGHEQLRSMRRASYWVGGVGVVLGVAGGVLIGHGRQQINDISNGGFATANDIDSRASGGKTEQLLGLAGVGLGVVAFGVAIPLFAAGESGASGEPRSAAGRKTLVQGVALPGGLGVQGRW